MPADRWPAQRVAMAAFRAGQGRPLDRIAADPDVRSMPAVVKRRLRRVGIAPGYSNPNDAWLNLEPATAAALAGIAQSRGETAEALAGRLLSILAADPTLAANVLDDG